MRLKDNDYKSNILEVLSQAEKPMDIYNIKVKAGIKNWETCKAILLELLIEGKIKGQRSTKGWTFWIGGG
jgi:hypothetical protein